MKILTVTAGTDFDFWVASFSFHVICYAVNIHGNSGLLRLDVDRRGDESGGKEGGLERLLERREQKLKSGYTV